MIGRLFSFAVLFGAAYWYWQGPHQAMFNPSPEQQLENIREEVELCIHGLEYQIGVGSGTSGKGTPEEYCADKHDVYRGEDGRWYSHKLKRKHGSR